MICMSESDVIEKPFEQWTEQEKALGYLDFYREAQRAQIKQFEELLEFEEKFVAHEPIIVANEVGGTDADDVFIANEQKLNFSKNVDDTIATLEGMIEKFRDRIDYANTFEQEIKDGDEGMTKYYAYLETERRNHLE